MLHTKACNKLLLHTSQLWSRSASHVNSNKTFILHLAYCYKWKYLLYTCRKPKTNTDRIDICQKKTSQQYLRIKSTISSYGYVPCCDFGIVLLHDSTLVIWLHHDYKDSDARFVHEVLEKWLEQDDSTEIRTPCTWKGLCDCISMTPGLPGSLAKNIRDEFCK